MIVWNVIRLFLLVRAVVPRTADMRRRNAWRRRNRLLADVPMSESRGRTVGSPVECFHPIARRASNFRSISNERLFFLARRASPFLWHHAGDFQDDIVAPRLGVEGAAALVDAVRADGVEQNAVPLPFVMQRLFIKEIPRASGNDRGATTLRLSG